MGQRCCGPSLSSVPKYRTLVPLIYQTETFQTVGQLKYQQLIQQLQRDENIKVLCQYLESHVKEIKPAFDLCRLAHAKHATKAPGNEVLCGVVTAQVVHRVIKTCIKIRQEDARAPVKETDPILQQESSPRRSYEVSKSANFIPQQRDEASYLSNLRLHEQEIAIGALQAYKMVMWQVIQNLKIKSVQLAPQNTSQQLSNYCCKNLIQINKNLRLILFAHLRIDPNLFHDVLNILLIILCLAKAPSQNNSQIQMQQTSSYMEKQNNFIEDKPSAFLIRSTINSSCLCCGDDERATLFQLSLTNYYTLVNVVRLHSLTQSTHREIVCIHLPEIVKIWCGLPSTDSGLSSAAGSGGTLQTIVVELFHSFFSLGEPEMIFRELIVILDRLKFHHEKTQEIQFLLWRVLGESQMKDSLKFKWLDCLISYLASLFISRRHNKEKSRRSSVHSEIEEGLNYLQGLGQGLEYQNLKSACPSWFEKGNVMGCLHLVKRWFHQNLAILGDVMGYKRIEIFTTLLANLSRGDHTINAQVEEIVSFLVSEDIRNMTYLVESALGVIRKVKIGQDKIKEHRKFCQFKQTREFDFMLEQSVNFKPTSIKLLKQNIRIIDQNAFLEQVIAFATFPYSRSLFEAEKMSKRGEKVYRKSEDSPLIKKNLAFKVQRVETLRQIDSEQKAGDKFKLYYQNVFQSIYSALLRCESLSKISPSNVYQFKLAALMMATHTRMLVIYASSMDGNLENQFIIALVLKINRFMARIYKQLVVLAQDTINADDQQQRSSEFSLIIWDSARAPELMSQGQTQKQESKINLQSKTYDAMLSCINQWVYPSLLELLNLAGSQEKNKAGQNYLRTMQFLMMLVLKTNLKKAINLAMTSLNRQMESFKKQALPRRDFYYPHLWIFDILFSLYEFLCCRQKQRGGQSSKSQSQYRQKVKNCLVKLRQVRNYYNVQIEQQLYSEIEQVLEGQTLLHSFYQKIGCTLSSPHKDIPKTQRSDNGSANVQQQLFGKHNQPPGTAKKNSSSDSYRGFSLARLPSFSPTVIEQNLPEIEQVLLEVYQRNNDLIDGRFSLKLLPLHEDDNLEQPVTREPEHSEQVSEDNSILSVLERLRRQ